MLLFGEKVFEQNRKAFSNKRRFKFFKVFNCLQKKHPKARRLNGQTGCREQPSINGDFSTSHNLCWHPRLGLRKETKVKLSRTPKETSGGTLHKFHALTPLLTPSPRQSGGAGWRLRAQNRPHCPRPPGQACLPRRKPRRPQTRPCDGQGRSGLPASPGAGQRRGALLDARSVYRR